MSDNPDKIKGNSSVSDRRRLLRGIGLSIGAAGLATTATRSARAAAAPALLVSCLAIGLK
jgi:hypothetical protein